MHLFLLLEAYISFYFIIGRLNFILFCCWKVKFHFILLLEGHISFIFII